MQLGMIVPPLPKVSLFIDAASASQSSACKAESDMAMLDPLHVYCTFCMQAQQEALTPATTQKHTSGPCELPSFRMPSSNLQIASSICFACVHSCRTHVATTNHPLLSVSNDFRLTIQSSSVGVTAKCLVSLFTQCNT